jgi:hypothetical protein
MYRATLDVRLGSRWGKWFVIKGFVDEGVGQVVGGRRATGGNRSCLVVECVDPSRDTRGCLFLYPGMGKLVEHRAQGHSLSRMAGSVDESGSIS